MFFRSLFYERTVLTILERVEQLPTHIQAEIAARVANFISQAKQDELPLGRLLEAARKQREKTILEVDNPDLEQWAAPALAEGWCTGMRGLSEATMDRHCAIAIVVAVESFATRRTLSSTGREGRS